MPQLYAIRPYLYYGPESEDTVSPEKAVEMASNCQWATLKTISDVIKVLLNLGFTPDNAALAITYGIHGAPAGTFIKI